MGFDDLQKPTVPRAGRIIVLPKGTTSLNHDKPRPFVLSSDCATSALATVVYGSTQATEASFGAASIEVLPARMGVNANRLNHPTRFYPGILYPVECSRIHTVLGHLGRRFPELRAGLRWALGVGTGTCQASEAPAGSRRGRLVRLKDEPASQLRTPIAVLLTEHAYSREKRYQVFLPILRGDALRSRAGGLVIESRPWLEVFGKPTTTAVVPVQLVQSAWYPAEIADETPYIIDEESLGLIEAELCTRLNLTP